ncbi:hypothetical protein AUM46_06315 [Cronobacter malonaticus]|uniref:Uncharacterized protein n=1 Tax=Cronobacter malonaticus TaxID=413503 RepID=A0ABX5K1U1_9ENTR|nr:hypothetical protein [Salmonella enterica subsp. enterica serovar Tennessee]PUX07311.1 hypothetical protein AUN13_18200 [Cronobacter malonaticus]PUX08297.1 hypothetical protein AUM46_06315 [Cronobacter malonaticus]
MENFQRKRLMPMAYALIWVSLAAAAVPAGQSLLMPDSTTTITPSSTTRLPEKASAALDGMSLDTIPGRPAISDLPPAPTEMKA